MTTIRHWVVGLTVLTCACLIPATPLRAQTPPEWASPGAVGDVFAGTQTAAFLPLIKVFGHQGGLKEQIQLGTTAASIRGFAFNTEKTVAGVSQYNLYVATDVGTVWKVEGTPLDTNGPPPPGPTRQVTVYLSGLSADIRALAFDEDGNLYVSYGGTSPKIEKYAPGSTTPSVTHFVQCDVNPAPGLWFDLSARTPTTTPKQFALYACGGTEIRSFDIRSAPPASGPTPTALFATLPNLPGNAETARDLVALAPTAPLGDDTQLDTVYGTQGGVVIAYGTNLHWLGRTGTVIGSFDFDDGNSNMNTWSSVAVSPTGGSVWGAETNSSSLTRFRLSSTFSPQPETRFDTSSTSVTALIVNGEPSLATHMQLHTVNGPPARYLKNTRWEHSIQFEGTVSSPVRFAVTSFEGQTAGTFTHFPDLNLDGRFNSFSGARAFETSRGRGNFYRTIRQTSTDVSNVDMRVTISYIHDPFDPTGSQLTGIYDDLDHSARGILADGGAVDQFDKNIRDEWFKTDSTARGSTRTSNDYLIGVQTGSAASLGKFKTAVNLGSSYPIRASYAFPVSPTFCNGLVLTVARDGGPPFVIVGSSLTTLNHNGEGIPYFTQGASNICQANLDVSPNSSEDPNVFGGPDFAKGRTYNYCVVFKDLETLPANTTPPADVCGTFLVK